MTVGSAVVTLALLATCTFFAFETKGLGWWALLPISAIVVTLYATVCALGALTGTPALIGRVSMFGLAAVVWQANRGQELSKSKQRLVWAAVFSLVGAGFWIQNLATPNWTRFASAMAVGIAFVYWTKWLLALGK